MATRRRARGNSLTNAMSDVRQRLQYLEARPSRSRIAAYAVRRTNVQPRAISTDQLDFQSATTEIIADDAVTNDKLAVDSVNTPQIADGAVTNPGLGGGAVDNRVLADNAVESRHIKDGEVKESDIGTDAVTRGKIKDGEVVEGKLATDSVTNIKIRNDAVTRTKILDGEVIESKLATNSVTRNKIADGEVIEGKLATNSVTRNKIADGEVIEGKLATNSVTRTKIRDGEVIQGKLGQGAVRTDNIDTRAVTNIKIADNDIGRGKLAFNAVVSVVAGTGLSGGGEVRDPRLSVDFNSVARASHTHSQYAAVNHPHNEFSSSTHVHFVSGNSGTAGTPPHQHPVNIASNSPSSLRYKKDITDYTFDLSKLMDLDLKKFRYLNQYKNRSANREWFFGYIAEEVQSLGLEELLAYDQDGLPSGVNYSLVGVFTLELVKMQEERIKTLEDQLQILSEEK